MEVLGEHQQALLLRPSYQLVANGFYLTSNMIESHGRNVWAARTLGSMCEAASLPRRGHRVGDFYRCTSGGQPKTLLAADGLCLAVFSAGRAEWLCEAAAAQAQTQKGQATKAAGFVPVSAMLRDAVRFLRSHGPRKIKVFRNLNTEVFCSCN